MTEDTNATRSRDNTRRSGTEYTPNNRGGLSRRVLLASLFAGTGCLNFGGDSSSQGDETAVEELATEPPDTNTINQYRTSTEAAAALNVVELHAPEFNNEHLTVQADTNNSMGEIISQAESKPASETVGNISTLRPQEKSASATTELRDLTRAVLGVGIETEFKATVGETTIRFQSGQIAETASYAAVAAHQPLVRVYVLQANSINDLQTIAGEVEV